MAAAAPAWTDGQRDAFERDGVVCVPGAFAADDAAAMAGAVWDHVEAGSGARRGDPASWPAGWAGVSFKRLRRRPVFAPVLASPAVHAALDGVFGPGGWKRPAPGVQVLMTFPAPGEWRLPHHLWHMDAAFDRPTWPVCSVKLFACVGDVRPGGGATLALAGSHRLVERHAAGLDPDDRRGNSRTWARFLRQDPWLDALQRPGPEPGRTERLRAGGVVDGVPMRVVELAGRPGDVWLTHLHVFHCVSPNVNAEPRIMVAKEVAAA